mmetsp:Transcript_38248/g.75834  ORF Transcript_38248/g.75834 Transcript_38248/m.75834 type:complete len:316 (+) Transcript_38248:213-1160(+)
MDGHPAVEAWVFAPVPQNRVGPLQDRLIGLTTHLSTWPASHCLAKWLEARQHQLGLRRLGFRILELGSGAGWLGLSIAANLPFASEIMLTERAEAFAELALRVAEQGNKASQVHTAVVDWRNHMPRVTSTVDKCGVVGHAGGAYNLVIGADLAWNAETCASLPWVWRSLLLNAEREGASSTIIYGHWLRSPKPLAELQLRCQEAGVVFLPCDLLADGAITVSITTTTSGGLPGPCLNDDTVLGIPDKDELLRGHCSSSAAGPSPLKGAVSGSVDDSDSDVDWTREIFDDESSWEVPIFQVYRVALSTISLAQEQF